MKNLRFDYSNTGKFVKKHEVKNMMSIAKLSQDLLDTKKGEGSEFKGWCKLPTEYDKD